MNRTDPFLTVDELHAILRLIDLAETEARWTRDVGTSMKIRHHVDLARGVIDRHRAATLRESDPARG